MKLLEKIIYGFGFFSIIINIWIPSSSLVYKIVASVWLVTIAILLFLMDWELKK